jgi:predicted nucleic acid-binding protein
LILVDTSVWIDHLHRADPALVGALERDEVAVHPLVIEELALGSIAERPTVLGLLSRLRTLPSLSHGEVTQLVESRGLWGRGLSTVDAHLLGSVLISRDTVLWTRDRRLREAAAEVGVSASVV